MIQKFKSLLQEHKIVHRRESCRFGVRETRADGFKSQIELIDRTHFSLCEAVVGAALVGREREGDFDVSRLACAGFLF